MHDVRLLFQPYPKDTSMRGVFITAGAFFVAGALLVMTPRKVDALSNPLQSFRARVVTVTTTAQSLTTLLGTTTPGVTGCAVKVSNPSATVVCIGGSDVDAVTTSGGKCYPICTVAPCAEQAIPVDGNALNQYLRVAAGTATVYLLAAGGC